MLDNLIAPMMGTNVKMVAEKLVKVFETPGTAALICTLSMIPGYKDQIPILEDVYSADLHHILGYIMKHHMGACSFDIGNVEMLISGNSIYLNGWHVYNTNLAINWYTTFKQQLDFVTHINFNPAVRSLKSRHLEGRLTVNRVGEIPDESLRMSQLQSYPDGSRNVVKTKRELASRRMLVTLLAIGVATAITATIFSGLFQ